MRGRICLTFTLRRYKEVEQEEKNIFPNFSGTEISDRRMQF